MQEPSTGVESQRRLGVDHAEDQRIGHGDQRTAQHPACTDVVDPAGRGARAERQHRDRHRGDREQAESHAQHTGIEALDRPVRAGRGDRYGVAGHRVEPPHPQLGRQGEAAARHVHEQGRQLSEGCDREGGRASAQHHDRGRAEQVAGDRGRRPGGDLGEVHARATWTSSATWLGVRATRTPAASRASAFAAAVPWEPVTMAPACPMRLPGGASNPAM